MNCEQARQCLSASHDGELDEAHVREARAHAAACPHCRGVLEAMVAVDAALDALPAPEPRPGFTGRLMARLSEAETPRASLWGWFRIIRPIPLALGAGAFLLGMLLAVSMNGHGRNERLPQQSAAQAQYVDAFELLPDTSTGARVMDLLQEMEK